MLNSMGILRKFYNFEYKLNSTQFSVYMQLWLNMITKNPMFSIWNIFAIFNFCMVIKGSFCREFKYLQYLYTFI